MPALVAALLAGCSDNATTPTSPTSVSLTTEMFTGTLEPHAQRFYSFTAVADSDMSVMLASLSTAGLRAQPDLSVGLGVGIPAGTGCDVKESVVTTVALTRQIDSSVTKGIHCVAIYDVGQVRESTTFAIRISHY